jgi:hypothetical protein
MLIEGEDTLETVGAQSAQTREVLRVTLRNRGRRDARIEAVGKRRWTGSWVFSDLLGQVPCDLPLESSKTVVVGADGGYSHGDISPRRYAVDGAGRTHPLRERYRQRL